VSAPRPARLVPVERFADVAWLYGIRESAATLQLTGRLTRVTVGRRDFYLRDDIDRLRSTVATRDRLLALAHRAITFAHMSVDDEVAALSALPRDGALRAFHDLCARVAERDHDAAEAVLDLMTGKTTSPPASSGAASRLGAGEGDPGLAGGSPGSPAPPCAGPVAQGGATPPPTSLSGD